MSQLVFVKKKPSDSPKKGDFVKTNTLYLDLLKNPDVVTETITHLKPTKHQDEEDVPSDDVILPELSDQHTSDDHDVNRTDSSEVKLRHVTQISTTESSSRKSHKKLQKLTRTESEKKHTAIEGREYDRIDTIAEESEHDRSDTKKSESYLENIFADDRHVVESEYADKTDYSSRSIESEQIRLRVRTDESHESGRSVESRYSRRRERSIKSQESIQPGKSRVTVDYNNTEQKTESEEIVQTTKHAKTIYVKRLKDFVGKDDVKAPDTKPKRKPNSSAPPRVEALENYYNMEDEQEKRTELLFQYEILRKLYPDAKIMPLNKFAPMSELEAEYNTVSRKIAMATTIDKSKKVFLMVLLGIELLLGKMGLDMNGFTISELNNMESYNDVLYELGKKYNLMLESEMAPELKILGLLTFSILAHLMSRYMETSGAEAVAGIIKQSTKHTFHNLFG